MPLTHLSDTLEPTKTQRTRSWTYLGTPESGTLLLERNGESVSYCVVGIGAGEWLVQKFGLDEVYTLRLGDRGVSCTCPSGFYRKTCVHADALAALIESGEF